MIIWENNTARYENGELGKLGKYVCFNISWDGSTAKGSDVPPWKLSTYLPGRKANLGNYKTIEDAQVYADKVLKIWMRGAGLKDIGNE